MAGQVRDVARGGSWEHAWRMGEGASRGRRKAVGLPGLGKPTLPPCFLVRARPEGWGTRHLLGQRVPLATWGTVWCQIRVLWPALPLITF